MCRSPSGVSIKSLERVIDPKKGRETVLVKLEPGARLPKETLKNRLELFVLEGSVQDGQPRRREDRKWLEFPHRGADVLHLY